MLNLVGGCLGASSQGPHFIGHHCETTAHVPRPGRFDGRIERQQVGLLGNPANHRQHLIDRRHLMRQLPNCTSGHADFIGHAFDVADRPADHFPRQQRFVTRSL
ncbi:hypothetical protein D3C73_893450 [compost metagenome]